MKYTIYITTLLLLVLTSCGSNKILSKDSVCDEKAIINDLGWVERIVNSTKIKEDEIPSVYKSTENNTFTVELPCWESDTDEYYTACVIVENKHLDNAIVAAKKQGINDIRRSINDSAGIKSEYINKAQFACLCIMKTQKKYIVNATIRIPKNNQ